MAVIKKNQENLKKFLVIQNSIQDEIVNQILDKILSRKKLKASETNFLERFEEIIELEIQDYSHISKNVTVEIIESLLLKKIQVICDLNDRDGKIGSEIISVKNDFLEKTCELSLKNNSKIELSDRFLYNLTYKLVKHHYSLTVQDEYFEKIFKEKDED